LRMLLRASVASTSRPVRPTRLPHTLARAYSQKPPLADTPPPPSPPRAESTPSPAPLLSVPTLDFGMEEPAARVRTGAKSAKDSLSSIERKRRRFMWVSSGLLVTGLVGWYIYLGREPDEKIDVCLSLRYLSRSSSLIYIRTARS
jgi:import inner membrane translocase subunit TIM50